MIFAVGDWKLDVDIEQTMSVCSKNLPDHCQCGYCRNFYAAIDIVHPKLRPFLSELGMHVETPDELMPFEPTLYEATYCICGRILESGTSPIELDGLRMRVLEEEELDYETHFPKPCFALVSNKIELPWILDEDMDEVISPANEPEYLQRMWTKLLNEAPEDNTFS